jgi:hypothetical protein
MNGKFFCRIQQTGSGSQFGLIQFLIHFLKIALVGGFEFTEDKIDALALMFQILYYCSK